MAATEFLPAEGDEADRMAALSAYTKDTGAKHPTFVFEEELEAAEAGTGSSMPPAASSNIEFASLSLAEKRQIPKVDAPMIDQKNPISEDEPGYIAKAFVRIFPFGIGDYHDQKSRLGAGLKFATWAKYILQYHDGRGCQTSSVQIFCLEHSHAHENSWAQECVLPLQRGRQKTDSARSGKRRNAQEADASYF